MSIPKHESYASMLEIALLEAGLGANPNSILGRTYRIGSEFGSHHVILSGTIQAISLSDEAGLDLYVSSPRFWGGELICVKWGARHGWSVLVRHKDAPSDEYQEVDFTLL